MTDLIHTRYSRHKLLADIGEEGQRKISNARVFVVGAGGLGSPICLYLAASGVGEITLTDFDQVELSNLQRQILHGTPDQGRNKVDSAVDAMWRINPHVTVVPLAYSLDDQEMAEQVAHADVVVDACDNFETRHTLNEACWAAGTPLVSGAAIRMEGQVAVFDPRKSDSPCYRCLYPRKNNVEGEPCSQVGVLSPLLGIVGSMQAAETLKLLIGANEGLTGRVILIDAASMELHSLRLPKSPDCPVCNV